MQQREIEFFGTLRMDGEGAALRRNLVRKEAGGVLSLPLEPRAWREDPCVAKLTSSSDSYNPVTGYGSSDWCREDGPPGSCLISKTKEFPDMIRR